MKFEFNRMLQLLSLLVLLSLVSCGGSWVDVNTGFGAKCTDEKVEMMKKRSISGMGRAIFNNSCSQIGKQYADDMRCEDGRLQVKCK